MIIILKCRKVMISEFLMVAALLFIIINNKQLFIVNKRQLLLEISSSFTDHANLLLRSI